jgi:hypothetical protein
MRRVRVLSTINFNHHAGVKAQKIGNVRIDWNLPTKLDPCKSSIAERHPKLSLCIRHAGAQIASISL